MKHSYWIASFTSLFLASCAAPQTKAPEARFNVEVAEIVDPDTGGEPAQYLVTASYAGEGGMMFPKMIVLEDTLGTMFVGTSGPMGDSGLMLEVRVKNDSASVATITLADDVEETRETLTIGVKAH